MKWFSIHEAMPIEENMYNIAFEDGQVWSALWNAKDGFHESGDYDEYPFEEVTHWAHLPKRPNHGS